MKRFKVLFAALAVMIASLPVAAQDANAIIDKYNQAAEMVSQKKFVEAIPLLTAVITDGTPLGEETAEVVNGAKTLLPKAYFQAGGRSFTGGDLNKALEYFEKSASVADQYNEAKDSGRAKTWIGNVYLKLGEGAFNSKDYAAAIESFSKGYAASPNNTDLALNLAKSYCEMGDTENGYKTYREIIALGDTHTKYADAVAKAKEEMGYYQTVEISKALEAKDTAKANEMMESILEADPQNATVNFMLIQTAVNQKDWNKVIARGDAAAAAQTTDAARSDINFFIGAAYQNKDNKAKAIEYYRKVTTGNNVANARAQITALG